MTTRTATAKNQAALPSATPGRQAATRRRPVHVRRLHVTGVPVGCPVGLGQGGRQPQPGVGRRQPGPVPA